MAEKLNLTDKIKHFLKLAEDKGATQAERDLASAQAERLILKHQIDRASLKQDEDEKPETAVHWVYGGKSSYSMDKVQGLVKVIRAMGGEITVTDYRSPTAGQYTPLKKQGIGINIYAMSGDLASMAALVASLDAQATIAMNAWWKSHSLNTPEFVADNGPQAVFDMKHEFYRAFGSGAAERIKEELDRGIAAAPDAPGVGLVLVERAAVVRQYAEQFMAGKVKSRGRMGGGGASAAGRAAGYEAAAGRSRGQRQAIGR
jgi:hypothetical protein